MIDITTILNGAVIRSMATQRKIITIGDYRRNIEFSVSKGESEVDCLWDHDEHLLINKDDTKKLIDFLSEWLNESEPEEEPKRDTELEYLRWLYDAILRHESAWGFDSFTETTGLKLPEGYKDIKEWVRGNVE